MGKRQDKAEKFFREGYNCSQSVFLAFADIYGLDQELALRISSSFGAGMGRMREVCGTVSGMLLVAGLECGTTKGKDPEGKKANYDTVQKLAAEFKKRSGGSIICRELLGLDKQKEFTDTKPEERTESYYKKRPCIQLIREAAGILERYLELEEETVTKDKQWGEKYT